MVLLTLLANLLISGAYFVYLWFMSMTMFHRDDVLDLYTRNLKFFFTLQCSILCACGEGVGGCLGACMYVGFVIHANE